MRTLALVAVTACGFNHGTVPGTEEAGVVNPEAGPPFDVPGPEWPYKRKLTIDNTGIDVLSAFPLLVVLDTQRIRYSPAGADLRFTDTIGTPLAHEIEAWNPTGRSYVWVRVPTIAAGTTTDLMMIYGNPLAIDAQMPTAVWDDNFVGVWHLVDGHDSTGKNASVNNGASTESGQIATSLSFDGSIAHYVDTMSNMQLTRWTIEAWIRPANAYDQSVTAGSSIISRFPNYLMLWDCQTAAFCHSVLYDGPQSSQGNGTYTASYSATPGVWRHVAGTYNGSALVAWTNGNFADSQSTDDPPLATTATARIGVRQDGLGAFAGRIDEARISRVARSSDYMMATVRAAEDNYVSFGPEEPN